jgi:hypothetical protein
MPCVRMTRHIAGLVVDYYTYAARPVASARRAACRVTHRDYFASRRLVVEYFAYAARPGASARRAARHTTRRRLLHLTQARRRLLRLRRTSGCLGTSRGLSRGSSSTTLCVATFSCGHTGSTSATLCVATTCLAATPTLLRVRHAPP